MEKHEGTNAVSNARIAIKVFAWLFMFGGIIVMLYGFAKSYFTEWNLVIAGISLIIMSALHFIIAAILKGFGMIVKASETYIKNEEDKVSEKIEDKTIRLPMQK